LNIHILKTVENSREDFSFNYYFSQINSMFGNLGKARADLSLELSIRVGNQCSQVRDSTLVYHGLSKLFSMLGNFTESSG
jgi:hypothetical protein